MGCNKVYITLLITGSTMNYDSIRKLPQYVRAGAGVVSLCTILAGCSSKTAQVKVPEVTAPTETPAVAELLMPEMSPESKIEPLYTLSSDTESKSPVRPHRPRVNIQRNTAPLETTISATNTVTSNNPIDTQIRPNSLYLAGIAGAGLAIGYVIFLLLGRRKKEENNSG